MGKTRNEENAREDEAQAFVPRSRFTISPSPEPSSEDDRHELTEVVSRAPSSSDSQVSIVDLPQLIEAIRRPKSDHETEEVIAILKSSRSLMEDFMKYHSEKKGEKVLRMEAAKQADHKPRPTDFRQIRTGSGEKVVVHYKDLIDNINCTRCDDELRRKEERKFAASHGRSEDWQLVRTVFRFIPVQPMTVGETVLMLTEVVFCICLIAMIIFFLLFFIA